MTEISMREREHIIMRQIFRRTFERDNACYFATQFRIPILINKAELDRRIIQDYPRWDGLNEDLLDLSLFQREPEVIKSCKNYRRAKPREKDVMDVQRKIIGHDYTAPELKGLPIPINRKAWEETHQLILLQNNANLMYR